MMTFGQALLRREARRRFHISKGHWPGQRIVWVRGEDFGLISRHSARDGGFLFSPRDYGRGGTVWAKTMPEIVTVAEAMAEGRRFPWLHTDPATSLTTYIDPIPVGVRP